MINRAGNKEKAKRVLNENGNLSGMVGMEILYRVIAAITSVLLGAMIAGGIGVVSAVVSAPFKLFGLAGIIIAYVLITPIATLVGAIAGGAVAGPFEVARYRYYLSLRKNGIRPKVTCIFDAFDFFMQFAIVTGVRMLTIMWIPVLIQFATLLLAAVVAAASRSYLAAMLLVMIGMIAALVVAAYHFYFMDLWAKDVNILCEKDGKHTVGVEKMMLFSVLTFGVYKYVWLAEIVDRICDNAAEYDVEVRQDSETFFVWMILVPVLGYLVAMYRAIRDTNRLAEAYERSRQKRTEVHDNPNTKPPPPCMRGRLSGLTGSLAGRSFELIPGRSVELGRNPAEVSLIVRGEKISRIHCTVQYNGKDLGFNVTDHSRNGVFVNGVRIPYNVPTYVSGKSIVALADGANKFQLIEAADEDDRSPALGADNEE